MKNLILSLGGFFIELGAILQLLVVIGLAITIGMFTYGTSSSVGLAWFVGIIALIILFIMFILGNYLFFMLINIHDSFVSMSRSLDLIAHNGTVTQTTQSPVPTQNALKCPNCGANYNNGDKFCEECGTKLS